ncbi:MAG: XTP3-transactivated protein A [Candidatus Woesebacteria bacterium GW2011_GWB1_39_12]|uniref:XTP3-transactivated protein A n=2 Tax=Candidatus Woeseibacteriota TaxID=1752722 RepID=A0A0G0MC22_9BACT|nr:MAG: XTP3-transactivated protein A [Candidatus Woesebacteria bacterium GW2011_GWA1_39_12]KKR00631.1 MAG: XTP3-transactivated protein A [Candidatus Woesebacteria bacterium GW2011_GWB1_39_12]
MRLGAIKKVTENIFAFNEAHGWIKQAPSDLAKSIVIEASELLEHFQWDESDRRIKGIQPKNWNEITAEVADIYWYLITFCKNSKIDLAEAVESKIIKLEEKYPAKMFNGKHNDEFYKAQKKSYREGRKY